MALRSEVFHNCRIKSYPDGLRQILVAQRDIFCESGWEARDEKRAVRASKRREESSDDSSARAKRRARSAVYDLAMSNPFRFFVTLTLDRRNVDRYDVNEVTRKLNSWLDNRVRRNGLAYVLVAEKHKDGGIHFHGFFNDALPVVDSGTLDTGSGKPRKPRSARERAALLAAGAHVVYNLPAWTLGFSTAIELYGERRAACAYVCKYISKAEEKVGGRWYYSGGALARPIVELCDVEYEDFCDAEGGSSFVIDGLGCRCVRFDVEGGVESVESLG